MMAFLALLAGLVLSMGVAAILFMAAQNMSESSKKPALVNDGYDGPNGIYHLFHEVVARHHSDEIKNLQREVDANLRPKAEEAISRQKNLVETDPAFQGQVIALAAYYDDLGTSLQNNWGNVPAEMSGTISELLHDAVIRHWDEFEKYKFQIHPEPASELLAGFEWLNAEMRNYREEKIRHNT